jgi:hypothetical protein
MASPLVVNYKAHAPEGLDDLPAGKGLAQRVTSTSLRMAFGLDLISLSFSRPSI